MEDSETRLKRKRERSPSFPYLDLQTSIEFAAKLFQDARMNQVRLADTANSWDMSPKSGSLMRYVAALGQYGLLDASGGGDDRRYQISQQARRIFEDDRPGVKEKLIAEAALRPKLIRDLYLGEGDVPKWGGDRPSDSIAESVLKFDLNFTPEAAKRFLSIYDAAVSRVDQQKTNSEDDEQAQNAEGTLTDVETAELSDSHSSKEVEAKQPRVRERTRPQVQNDDASREPPIRSAGSTEWFRARVGKEKTVTVHYSGSEEIGPKEIAKLIALLEAQKIALED